MHFSNRKQLSTFIKDKCQNGVLIANIPDKISKQRGQTCKLYALGHAMAVYEKFISGIPPVRASDQADSKEILSLRKQAKQKYTSKVGEIYNPEHLIGLARDNKMSESRVIIPVDSSQYIDTVKGLINRNHASLLFYDIGVRSENRGEVIKRKGNNEHGAACVGYCSYEERLHFIVCQWGEFYLHPADEIAQSALQIEKRIPESFLKIKQPFLGTQWAEEEALREQLRNDWLCKYLDENILMDALRGKALKTEKALPSTSDSILGRCIFDIHPETAALTHGLINGFDKSILEFETYVNEHKSKSKHKEGLAQLISVLKQNKDNFKVPEQRDAAISSCLSALDKAEQDGIFEHESNVLLRVIAKISLALAVLCTFGLAALVKQEYSYKTTGRHTVFADITRTQGKMEPVREVLQEHVATHFGTL